MQEIKWNNALKGWIAQGGVACGSFTHSPVSSVRALGAQQRVLVHDLAVRILECCRAIPNDLKLLKGLRAQLAEEVQRLKSHV
jgi:hypothetical protein